MGGYSLPTIYRKTPPGCQNRTEDYFQRPDVIPSHRRESMEQDDEIPNNSSNEKSKREDERGHPYGRFYTSLFCDHENVGDAGYEQGDGYKTYDDLQLVHHALLL